jgi:hypothetical protein
MSLRPTAATRLRVATSPSVDVGIVRAVDDVDTATSGNRAPTNRPVRPAVGAYTGWKCRDPREEGDASVVTADLISRAAIVLSGHPGRGVGIWSRSLHGLIVVATGTTQDQRKRRDARIAALSIHA